jgi:hypothetical protein
MSSDLILRGKVVGTFPSETEARTMLDKIVGALTRTKPHAAAQDPSFGYEIRPGSEQGKGSP